jgi:hypothetical protein
MPILPEFGRSTAALSYDHNNLFFCPAQPQRLLPQAILALCTLLMLKYLAGGRLSDVEYALRFRCPG